MELWRQPMWGVRIPATPLSTILQSGFRRTLMCRTKSKFGFCLQSTLLLSGFWKHCNVNVKIFLVLCCLTLSAGSVHTRVTQQNDAALRGPVTLLKAAQCTAETPFQGHCTKTHSSPHLHWSWNTFCIYELVIRIFTYDQLTVLGQTGSSSTVQIDIFQKRLQYTYKTPLGEVAYTVYFALRDILHCTVIGVNWKLTGWAQYIYMYAYYIYSCSLSIQNIIQHCNTLGLGKDYGPWCCHLSRECSLVLLTYSAMHRGPHSNGY